MSKLYLYLAGVAGILFVLAGAYGYGYHQSNVSWKAKYATWQKQEADKINTIQSQNVSLQAELDKAKSETQTRTVTLTRTVVRYENRYIPVPGKPVESRPDYFLRYLDVSLFNTALEGGIAAGSSGIDATDPKALTLSPVSFNDLEANVIVNYGQYKDCRDIVNGWQEWYRNAQKIIGKAK